MYVPILGLILCLLMQGCKAPVEVELLDENPHKNIEISRSFKPNEPTIVYDPKQPNLLLAGANIDNLYRSEDRGQTWSVTKLKSKWGVWGDPVLINDTKGQFYFFHLSNYGEGSWLDRIVCQRSSDQGKTWTAGSYMGLNGTKAQDKHWAVVNPKNNHIYTTWSQFDKYGSDKAAHKSAIMFSVSKDDAESWAPAKQISITPGDCIDDDNTLEGAVPTIGPNGGLYVAWAGPEGLVFNRSLDAGETWLEDEINIDPMPGGWTYDIPGIYRCNGLPVTFCDLSKGPNRGRIYINWSDQRNGLDDTDVWLIWSDDQGDTWSKPVRVNDDKPGAHQFLTWMTVDQSSGKLYGVFYDRRNLPGTATNVYLAYSDNGGKTFINRQLNDKPFVPTPGIFFGDYNNIVAHKSVVRPIWTELHHDTLCIKTALVDLDKLEKATWTNVDFEPEAARDIIYFSFKVKQESTLEMDIYTRKDSLVKKLFEEAVFKQGKHVLTYTRGELKLPKGSYFYRLKKKNKVIRQRTFEIK